MNNIYLLIYFWKISKINFKNAHIYILLLMTILLFISALSSLIPYIMKSIIDHSNNFISTPTSIKILYILIISYCIAWVTQEILTWVKNIVSAYLMVNLENSILNSSLNNFLNLNYNEQKKINSGILNTDVQRGATAFGQINFIVFLTIFPTACQLIFMCLLLGFDLSWLLSLLFFMFSILIFIITIKINKKSTDSFSKMYESRNILNKFFLEKISIPYEIKIHNSKDYEMKKFNILGKGYTKETYKTNKIIGKLMINQVFFIAIFLTLFMLIATFMFTSKNLTTGSFVLISTYIIQLTTPFIIVSQNVMQLNGHLVSLKNLKKYFELKKDNILSTPLKKSSTEKLFSFNNVELELSNKLIPNFNYNFLNNKIYAIIGRTGTGKTSFINYFLGISKAKKGSIFYKKIDITNYFYEDIFKEVTFVSQNPSIISGSFRENLIYNNYIKNINENYIIELLKIFNLYNILVEKNLNLDSNIDDITKNFSGGEVQRINIIRAYLKNPTVLILDEPTSALDETTGKKIINFLRENISCLIIITHTKYCIDIADDVINIDELKSKY